VRPTGTLAAPTTLRAAATAGCGLGPGEDQGEVELTVSRDFGTTVMEQETESIKESDTVLRVLDRNADVDTRYGGGFVQSIDGLAGGVSGGRRTDWFFYVNGIESPIGSAEYDLSDGDRIWWDHHDWTAAMRVPAVVGSWPEPLVHGFRDDRWDTALACSGPRAACDQVSSRLAVAGVHAPSAPGAGDNSATDAVQVVVGNWESVRANPDAAVLSAGPDRSGVYASFSGDRRPLLELLNQRGEPAGSLGHGAGLVAALRPDDGPPTWVVTGTDKAGVRAAAGLLGDALRNHFAVATDGGQMIPVPVP
jgi:Domain of unknown function (DUF4430)